MFVCSESEENIDKRQKTITEDQFCIEIEKENRLWGGKRGVGCEGDENKKNLIWVQFRFSAKIRFQNLRLLWIIIEYCFQQFD